MFASLFPSTGDRARSQRRSRPSYRLAVEQLEERQLLNAQIDVIKFLDLDGNGMQDAGEPGLVGVPIQLLRDGNVIATRFTLADDPSTPWDDSGQNWFSDLPPGNYLVREIVPPGFAPTTPTQVQISLADGEIKGAVFGNRGRPGQIDILKFNDLNGNGALDAGEPGLPGVTVELLREGVVVGTRVTTSDDLMTPDIDEGGQNWFVNLAPGTYLVREIVPADFLPTTPSQVQVTLAAGDIKGVFFGNRRAEGCTPGYWKNNAEHHGAVAWGPTGYSPNQKVSSVFSSVSGALGNQTLLQALNAGGGGVNALLRHAVAAVLNAAHPDVHYALTVNQIVNLVNAAINSGDATVIESLKDRLAHFNELGCGIDQQGRRTGP